MILRIAMVGACPYPVPQGSQVLLRDTALAMQARGHEVHLVVYGHGIGDDGSGLRIHRCARIPGDQRTQAGPYPAKPLQDLALVLTLRRVIREQRIDVIHAHNYEALIVALCARKRPIVYHAHNAMSDELPYYFEQSPMAARFGRWLDRHVPRRADRIVAPHRRLAGHLIVRGCDHEKIAIVPPPLDGNLFEAIKPGKEVPPVLYAGNLDPYQNLGLLYNAMDLVRAKIPYARFIVATAERQNIPGAEVVNADDLAAVQRVMADDSIFAAPRVSWSGYPIKLLNAMAAGKAIVACESAAYPIIDRHNGLVVPDNDARAFAEALIELMTNPKLRAELGRRAREMILADHRPESIAQQLEAIDVALLESRGLPEAKGNTA